MDVPGVTARLYQNGAGGELRGPEKEILVQHAGLGILSKKTSSGLDRESTGAIRDIDDGKEFQSGATPKAVTAPWLGVYCVWLGSHCKG